MFVSFEKQFGNVRCLNNDPKFDVTIKCKDVELERVNYATGLGHHSFEIYQKNMKVMIVLTNNEIREYKCDRVTEEFNKLLLIKNFEEISFKMEDVKTIYVRK